MRLCTKASNQNSTIKIQYPVFYGSKAEEINSLILDKVQDMASLDPSLFPENPMIDVNYQSANVMKVGSTAIIIAERIGSVFKQYPRLQRQSCLSEGVFPW